MSVLLEPPPLLALVVVVGVAVLAVVWGTRGAVFGRDGPGRVPVGESEDAERWAADDPPLPQKARYAYPSPVPVKPAPSPPVVAAAVPVPAAGTAAPREVVHAPAAEDGSASAPVEDSNQSEHLEMSLAGFFGGGSRARTPGTSDGEQAEAKTGARSPVRAAVPGAQNAPRELERSVGDGQRAPESD